MRAPNLFGVSDEVVERIDAWLQARVAMTVEERDADRPPIELDRNFSCSAQLAVSQLCAEQPFLVIVGAVAVCMIPVLLLVGWVFGK